MDLTAVELSGKIKAGEVTAVEAVQAVLAHIDEVEPKVHAYVGAGPCQGKTGPAPHRG